MVEIRGNNNAPHPNSLILGYVAHISRDLRDSTCARHSGFQLNHDCRAGTISRQYVDETGSDFLFRTTIDHHQSAFELIDVRPEGCLQIPFEADRLRLGLRIANSGVIWITGVHAVWLVPSSEPNIEPHGGF